MSDMCTDNHMSSYSSFSDKKPENKKEHKSCKVMKSIAILELRKQTRLSQSQFAKEFHIQLKTLQSWEQGWRNTPECILYMIQRILELESDK